MLKQVKLNPDIAVILKPEILAKTKVLSAPKTAVLFQLEIVCVFPLAGDHVLVTVCDF